MATLLPPANVVSNLVNRFEHSPQIQEKNYSQQSFKDSAQTQEKRRFESSPQIQSRRGTTKIQDRYRYENSPQMSERNHFDKSPLIRDRNRDEIDGSGSRTQDFEDGLTKYPGARVRGRKSRYNILFDTDLILTWEQYV